MIKIDETWNKIDEDNYYRISPVQPRADKFTHYQFVRLSYAKIIELELPNLDNRKELEKIALGNKWITRRNKLDGYLQNNPNCLTEYLFNLANNTLDIRCKYDIYFRHPNGNSCYTRWMISTDPGYNKGMSAIVDLETEEVYMKNFDNVGYYATLKGYTHIDKREALKLVIRNNKLENILK